MPGPYFLSYYNSLVSFCVFGIGSAKIDHNCFMPVFQQAASAANVTADPVGLSSQTE